MTQTWVLSIAASPCHPTKRIESHCLMHTGLHKLTCAIARVQPHVNCSTPRHRHRYLLLTSVPRQADPSSVASSRKARSAL